MALSDCALSSGYTKDCANSIGGIKTVYLAALSDKSTLTAASGSVTAFTLSQGKQFYTFELKSETATASDNDQTNGPNGTFYCEHKLTFRIPKRSASTSQLIKTLAINELMAIVLDNDGNYWLLGASNESNGNNGLTKDPGENSWGTNMGDMNGYILSFTGKEPHLALKVPSNLISTLTSPAA